MDVAIVGGGIAGLAVAYELSKQGIVCELFEKARVVGGRLTTRYHHGSAIDLGAQFFTVRTPEFETCLREIGAVGKMKQINVPIVTYPFANLREALTVCYREEQEALGSGLPFPHRYVFQDGMAALAQQLADHASLCSLNLETYVEGIKWDETSGRWILHTRGDNTTLGGASSARFVVFTLPAPQTAHILSRSETPSVPLITLAETLNQVNYDSCVTVILQTGQDQQWELVGAFRGVDGNQPINWMTWGNRIAPENYPEGDGAIILNFSPEASHQIFDLGEDIILAATQTALHNDLSISLPTLRWLHVKRWRYANPQPGWLSPDLMASAAKQGIFVGGDFVEKGRVESAYLSGYRLAQELIKRIEN
ncbi:MAG: FAD-dependent oxidoreductase [Blastocatellia bacterium]|nr:FAD-dependent oxidoreductase [Blastocatellia bacterium]